ncbi:MAG TPA: histidine kinase dimerization/phospho-acceptor domain-containing protein [Chitinispirillaceae bacterium]|nr:histidine kinase dimerization/phospho-acceptor domain-containing protein [Chitinispirillaceae bacterium]
MRISIGPKLFIGFLVVIFLNVFFFVIVSKMENVNTITRILKKQNEIKNDILRLKTLHRIQGPSIISYEKIGHPQSVHNFQQTQQKIISVFDSICLKYDSIINIDSALIQQTIHNQNYPGPLQPLKMFLDTINVFNKIYSNMFDSIVMGKPNGNKKLSIWRNLLNDADNRISSAMDSAEIFIEQQTNLRIKDVESRVNNIKQMTLLIIAGVTLFAIIFAYIFSQHITNALRRLKESASTIGRGDFNVAPSGYPNDEIGDLATAFFEMAIDLKNTQEDLIKSKRLAAIGEVVASVNHEINNPLMIISGNAQFLEMTMEGYPKEMLERIKTILEETERISKVTRKLREIKNPVVEDYTSSGEQMINLDKSSQ